MPGFSGGERSARVNKARGSTACKDADFTSGFCGPADRQPLHSVTLATELKVGPSDRPH